MTKKKNKKNKTTTIYPTLGGGATIDNKTTTTTKATQTTYTKPACHKGNTAVYKEPEGGTLYIGGWTNGATFDWNTHVIDLTGLEHKYWDIPIAYDDASKDFLPFLMQAYAGWLSLPFPDYGTPSGLKSKEQWVGIAETIRGILRKGNDVLVACHGGHGRSGLFVAIVGYLLNIKNDPTWGSPVEKVRQIHCDEAVETYAQEKFVYEILGLRIQPKHAYFTDNDPYFMGRGSYGTTADYSYSVGSTFKTCPICGTQSLYVDEYGMCMTCRKAFESQNIPVREDLTLKDIEHRGEIEHSCDDDKCMGIWKASKCGHVVHNQIIYEGLCETCYRKQEDEKDYAELKLAQNELQMMCALCGKVSVASEKYGICFECSSRMVQNHLVSDVHNSITDPYKFIPHSNCEDEHMCVGIIRADNCQHVVHNREIEDGLCPSCYEIKNGHKQQEAK